MNPPGTASEATLAAPPKTLRSGPRPAAAFDRIRGAIGAVADLPLASARTLPAAAYTSEEFFEWESAHLLRGGWQALAHVSQIPKPGDFLNLDLLGEPLILVRDKDGAVRVMSRVCPHRSMDIMPPGFGYDGHGPAQAKPGMAACGHTRLFLCPYHSWTFELDGRLKACPEMQQAEGFIRDDVGLTRFRSEVWQGFILVNLDGAAPPFSDGLEEMAADLAPYNLTGMELVVSREWECPFNWKVLVENFMESYHHLGIHHRSLQPMMPARDTWCEGERRRYMRSHLPYRESVRAEYAAFEARGDFSESPPPVAGLHPRQKSEWGLFLAPPTFLLATAHDRVLWYRLQPLGADRMKLLTTVLVDPSLPRRDNFPKLLETITRQLVDFHLEDMQVCTAVQRGLHSGGWQQGRLSHLEMTVWLFQRYLAARLRGTWPTDDRPAAQAQTP